MTAEESVDDRCTNPDGPPCNRKRQTDKPCCDWCMCNGQHCLNKGIRVAITTDGWHYLFCTECFIKYCPDPDKVEWFDGIDEPWF